MSGHPIIIESPRCGAFCDEYEGDQVASHSAHAAGHPEYEEEPGDRGREAHQDPGAAAERHRQQEARLAAVLQKIYMVAWIAPPRPPTWRNPRKGMANFAV